MNRVFIRSTSSPLFAQRNIMECLVGAAGHSGLMLAARITLLHFSVSLTMKDSKSAEDPANIALPRSERRVCTWGSARIALISLLSLSTITPGVLSDLWPTIGSPRSQARNLPLVEDRAMLQSARRLSSPKREVGRTGYAQSMAAD